MKIPERGGQAKSAGLVTLLRNWVVSLTGFSTSYSIVAEVKQFALPSFILVFIVSLQDKLDCAQRDKLDCVRHDKLDCAQHDKLVFVIIYLKWQHLQKN